MHLRLDGIPSPAAVRIDGNVIEGVELETHELLMAFCVMPISNVPVPEVKDSPINRADSSSHIHKEWLALGPIMLLLTAIGGSGVDLITRPLI